MRGAAAAPGTPGVCGRVPGTAGCPPPPGLRDGAESRGRMRFSFFFFFFFGVFAGVCGAVGGAAGASAQLGALQRAAPAGPGGSFLSPRPSRGRRAELPGPAGSGGGSPARPPAPRTHPGGGWRGRVALSDTHTHTHARDSNYPLPHKMFLLSTTAHTSALLPASLTASTKPARSPSPGAAAAHTTD